MWKWSLLPSCNNSLTKRLLREIVNQCHFSSYSSGWSSIQNNFFIWHIWIVLPYLWVLSGKPVLSLSPKPADEFNNILIYSIWWLSSDVKKKQNKNKTADAILRFHFCECFLAMQFSCLRSAGWACRMEALWSPPPAWWWKSCTRHQARCRKAPAAQEFSGFLELSTVTLEHSINLHQQSAPAET